MNASPAGSRPHNQGTSPPCDRRSHPRHQAHALGVTVLCRGCDAPAELVDISLGGMAVLYTPEGPGPPSAAVCDLIEAGAESALPRALACRAVYDIAMLAEGRSFSGSAARQRGFRFSSLKEDQKRAVELLIRRSGAAL